MYSLPKEFTDGGLNPPLTFVKGKPTTVTCYFTLGIKNGKLTTPDGEMYACSRRLDLGPKFNRKRSRLHGVRRRRRNPMLLTADSQIMEPSDLFTSQLPEVDHLRAPVHHCLPDRSKRLFPQEAIPLVNVYFGIST
jgi:hypothetical protein